MTDRYIGLMSGTSLDGIDAVLVDFTAQQPRLLAAHKEAIPADLRDTLLGLNHPAAGELARMARADVELAEHLADAVRQVLAIAGITHKDVMAIGSHGQTLRHAPDEDTPYTLQIGDPNTIAERTGITTIADFRRRDLVVGGQGAPLMPAFHAAMLHSHNVTRAVVNIGGMANITVLPTTLQQAVSGFDTGPGNVLMDSWYQQHEGKPYDQDGKWGASGKVDDDLLARMLRDPFFALAPPKSTGRDHFDTRWLDKVLRRHKKRMVRKNVQATLCELTAVSIANAIESYADDAREVIVCGGGVHNTALMFRLQVLLGGRQLHSSEDFGIDPDYMEAIGFAWLAKQTLEGKPGNLPSVTGAAKAVLLGGIYPA